MVERSNNSEQQLPADAAGAPLLSRRRMLATGTAAALAVPAVSLLGLPGSAAGAQTISKAAGIPSTAPVPPPAKGPAIPSSGYLVQEIEHNVYWLTDGLYQTIFLVTGEGVVIIDAPPTLGHNILRAVKDVTRQPIRHAVYSHHHADHTGAMALYEHAAFYAHEDTAALVARNADPNRPRPKHLFRGSHVLHVGDEQIHLAYHGPNHSPGNTFVYLPRQKVLMLVDVVFPGWVPFAYLAESQDIPGWMAAPAQALRYPFTTFVGGHLTRLGTRDDVHVQQQYVAELKTEAAKAIATFDPAQIFAEVDPTNPWAVFNGYLDALAGEVTDAVTPRWINRLGGADVYTRSNAYITVDSLRIDSGQLGPFGIRP